MVYGGEEICDEKEDKEYFDKSKKEKIVEVAGTLKVEEFVTEEEISQVVEKKVKLLVKL